MRVLGNAIGFGVTLSCHTVLTYSCKATMFEAFSENTVFQGGEPVICVHLWSLLLVMCGL